MSIPAVTSGSSLFGFFTAHETEEIEPSSSLVNITSEISVSNTAPDGVLMATRSITHFSKIIPAAAAAAAAAQLPVVNPHPFACICAFPEDGIP